jgi:hypothetical protein
MGLEQSSPKTPCRVELLGAPQWEPTAIYLERVRDSRRFHGKNPKARPISD